MEIETQHEQAALDVAENILTNAQIAIKAKVDARTLLRWKQDADFQSRVEVHLTNLFDVIKRSGIGRMENRVNRLDRHWRGMQAVIESRAREAGEMLEHNEAFLEATRKLTSDEEQVKRLSADLPYVAPGMETGLVVRKQKIIEGKVVEEFAVDTALLAEIRNHEMQAAKELGQWSDKAEISGKDGAPLNVHIFIPDNGRDRE